MRPPHIEHHFSKDCESLRNDGAKGPHGRDAFVSDAPVLRHAQKRPKRLKEKRKFER